MKVAVCFFGFLRRFDATHPSLNECLIKPFNADVYMYCPPTFFNTSNNDPWVWTKDTSDNVSESYVQSIFGDNLKKIVISDKDTSFYKTEVANRNLPEISKLPLPGNPHQITWRILSMYDSIKNTIALKTASNIAYDVTVLIRPDLLLYHEPNLDQLDLNLINFSQSHTAPVFGTNTVLGDHMMVSNNRNIYTLTSLYDNVERYYNEKIIINNETMIGHHLSVNGIGYRASNFIRHDIVR